MASRKTALMQLQVSLPIKIVSSVLIMFALILFVYFFSIPNPNMILIAGMVLCSALFGFGGGGIAALIMLGYTLFFFSTDHSFVHFTTQNIQKVVVSLIGITADMFLVCFLKQTEVLAFREVENLTEHLHRENEKLLQISVTDGLTGIRNRIALRQDYASYQGHEAAVMMLDLNDFKTVNDTRGHEEGDRILKQTGTLLADTFGAEHCYRYGGDEFLVILPDISEETFRNKMDSLKSSDISFSVGYAFGMLSDQDRLRSLIASADEKMYEVKRYKNTEQSKYSRQPQKNESEYTVAEMQTFIREMSERYALARVVDPIECRIIEMREDGSLSMNERCYGIWNAEQKCINCSSAIACRTGCHQEKAEHFDEQDYFIQSNPVTLKLNDGSTFNAVVELVNVEKDSHGASNDRAAENIGTRSAHYRAHHDSLTNVLTADAFYELSRDMIINSGCRKWNMITANIMNFRYVNTLFGVPKGNELLVRTASMLKELSEASRGLCGRLGGDQFALLIPKEKYRDEMLKHVSYRLKELFNSGAYTLCIHFGVYEIDDPSIPVSVMCGRANSALRTIREDMTNEIASFNDAIMDQILREQFVIGGFEDALRSRQFEMYLQPFARKDGTIFGAEALVRWNRPDGTVMQPDYFIEILERAGLIHKLDMYMWEYAVKQLKQWNGNLAISVNVSARDFFSIDVYDVLNSLVEKYDVDSRLLRLEITETALQIEPEKINAVVSKLRGRGFIVEIDDFGTGYASLSMLKKIHADALKIDRDFLNEIEHCKRNSTILQNVIRLAESLGMDVIVEGVETEQQLVMLTDMGCRHFQGYYFSKPVPVSQFETRYIA
ncbi:MAG: EAL domain-containing protein [Clostridia bacterium]|nr:EAL domain-containing protein [Clostridia bacterium]